MMAVYVIFVDRTQPNQCAFPDTYLLGTGFEADPEKDMFGWARSYKHHSPQNPLVLFTGYCQTDSIKVEYADSTLQIMVGPEGQLAKRLELVAPRTLGLVLHHRDDRGGYLNLGGGKERFILKGINAQNVDCPAGWPLDLVISDSLATRGLQNIAAQLPTQDHGTALTTLSRLCTVAPDGAAEEPRRTTAEAVPTGDIVWLFGRLEEDETFEAALGQYWTPYTSPAGSDPPLNVTFVSCKQRTTLDSEFRTKLRQSVTPQTIVFVHGVGREEWPLLAGAAEVLGYGSNDRQYDEMFERLVGGLTAGASPSAAVAAIAYGYVETYRRGVERNFLRHFKHRVVNMFDPLALDVERLDELAREADVLGIEEHLRAVKENWALRPSSAPLAMLDEARRFLFGRTSGPAANGTMEPWRLHFLKHGRSRFTESLVNTRMCEAKGEDFCKRIAALLGVSLPNGKWEPVRGSWVERYLAAFHTIVIGGATGENAEAVQTRGATTLIAVCHEAGGPREHDGADAVATLMSSGDLSGGAGGSECSGAAFAGLRSWLLALSREFEEEAARVSPARAGGAN